MMKTNKYLPQLVCVLAVLPCLPASAANELVLQLETALTRDTNPLRFTDQANTDPGLVNSAQKQTDTVAAADLRFGAIVPVLSDQTRLVLTGSLGNRHYKNYSQLDHQTGGADLAFDWVAGHALSGRISAGKSKRLFQYINGSLTERDLSHEQRAGSDWRLRINNDFLLAASLSRSGLDYDLPVNQLYNFREHSKQAGLRYTSTTGSMLEGGLRWSDTEFPQRTEAQITQLDRAYKEREAYLDAEWNYSVKTVFSTHLGLIKRSYETLSERDTNLLNTIVRGTYLYSPQLRFDLQLFDRPFSIVDPAILYVQTKGIRLDSSWKYSPKLQWNASVLWQDSDQKLIPRFDTAAALQSRKEKLQRLGFGGNYLINRGFRLFLDSAYERTQREADGVQLKQAIIKLGFEYTYENIAGSAARMGLNRYQQFYSATEATK